MAVLSNNLRELISIYTVMKSPLITILFTVIYVVRIDYVQYYLYQNNVSNCVSDCSSSLGTYHNIRYC